MKTQLIFRVRLMFSTMIALLLALLAATPLLAAGPARPASPPPYPLKGDDTNSSGGTTHFESFDPKIGWEFSTLQAGTAIRAECGQTTRFICIGVEGEAKSDEAGTGVYGHTKASAPNSSGVEGYAYSENGRGAGVYGHADSTQAIGVYGSSPNIGVSGFGNVGVHGSSSDSNQGAGVFGDATGGALYGVIGLGLGTGSTGVVASSVSSYGLYAHSDTRQGAYIATSNGPVALQASNPNPAPGYYAIVADGNVQINGNYVATGTKSASVLTTQGRRLMYAAEATKNIFTDQGAAQLVHGRAVIQIDPLYAQTVNLGLDYQVFLTPRSFESKGLVVGNLTATSFEVREVNGGQGNYRFDWRIDALRKGYEKARMMPAPSIPAPPTAPAIPAAPPARIAPPAGK